MDRIGVDARDEQAHPVPFQTARFRRPGRLEMRRQRERVDYACCSHRASSCWAANRWPWMSSAPDRTASSRTAPLTTTVTQSLDIEQHDTLLAYLRAAGHVSGCESPAFTTLRGGVSSRAVLVRRADGRDWVIKQSLAKLRVDVDWYGNPERIHREAVGIRWLGHLAPPSTVPALLFEDHEHHLLAMDAVPQPHCSWKTALLAGALEMDHVRQFGHLLGTIHRRASERQTEIAGVFDDRSVFESLRVEPYYGYTASQVPECARFMANLISSVRARRLTLVHGDYSPKNILVHAGRLVLLDHEVIHFGDPAFDLGFSMAHFLSKAHHVEAQREEFTYAAETYWRAYRESLGDPEWARDLEEHAIRNTLGCLLARVAGRSPLEYLSDRHRQRQRDVVLSLMRETPLFISDLVQGFSRGL
jgi:tRNA A-37 threonylcarbamoyl transferase component Bud32